MDAAYPQTRWVDVLQNEFAARAAWCVQPYKNANHPPVVKIKQSVLAVKPGQRIKLQAKASDPDGNKIRYTWWQYHEVDTYAGKLLLADNTKANLTLTIPPDAKPGDDIHLILSATDTGTPALTRYGRVVLKVKE